MGLNPDLWHGDTPDVDEIRKACLWYRGGEVGKVPFTVSGDDMSTRLSMPLDDQPPGEAVYRLCEGCGYTERRGADGMWVRVLGEERLAVAVGAIRSSRPFRCPDCWEKSG